MLDRHAKRKGLVKKPLAQPRPSKPEHVPAHVRRAVWERDGGRCQHPLASGGFCGSSFQVEIDHIVPRALGGPPTVENLRCACKAHNLRAGRAAFGDAWMDRFTRNPRCGPAATAFGRGIDREGAATDARAGCIRVPAESPERARS